MTESPKLEDLDPVETREWLESIDSVLKTHGPERAHFLLERLIDYTRRSGAYLPFKPNTAYVNSIPTGREPEYPGNRALERRIEAYIRWNALAMVLQANKKSSEYGGHLSSYASSATLYEVGFNHVWRAPSEQHPGDMVFIQGHSSPGIYARAYLEGRLTEEQLRHFRQEAGGPGTGLSSYPHPWLMPDFWQFPTVSMGLGPMTAIFQARFTRYLEHRGLVKPSDQKVWAFLGDGEMDEPESMGALTMPVREGLDNLIFVINCNLQRLDGPVRGNGKIIQELEAAFLGAGWNVLKVLWGSRWDPLLARDTHGLLRRVMEECVDGEYQNFKAKGGAYTREHFFGKYPELKAMVANMSDEEIWRLNRGGHDPRKVYAAYAAAAAHNGQPTVILAKTVKGFGLGKGGEGQMIAHQARKTCARSGIASTSRSRMRISGSCHSASPTQRPKRRATSTSGARRSEASCRPAAAPPRRSSFRRSRPSGRSSREPPTARSRRPWRSCALSPCCSRTRTSGAISCRSCPMRRAPSAWRDCSGRSASIPPSGSSTRPRTPRPSCPTARTRRARCWRRASTRRGRSARGWPPAPPTASTASTWCRSTSSIRCSASSASGTSSGPPATCRRGASWSARPPGGLRWQARACSTRTVTASFSRAPCRTAWPTIRRTRTSSRSSFTTACAACTPSRNASSITSR